MASTDRQRWARVLPALAWKHPGLPTTWTRVLERNPEAMNPEPLPGHVWLDTPGKCCMSASTNWSLQMNRQRVLAPKKIHRRRDADPKSPTAPSSTSA
jgi:hypothetical protein